MAKRTTARPPRKASKRKRDKKPRPLSALTAAQRRFAAEFGLDYDALSDADKAAIFERFAAFQAIRRFHAPDLVAEQLERLIGGHANARSRTALNVVVLMVDGQLIETGAQLDGLIDLASSGVKADLIAVRASRANRFDGPSVIRFGDTLAETIDACQTPAPAEEFSEAFTGEFTAEDELDPLAGEIDPTAFDDGAFDDVEFDENSFAENPPAALDASATSDGASTEMSDEAYQGALDLLRRLLARARKIGVEVRLRVYAYYSALGAWSDEADSADALAQARSTLAERAWLADVEVEAIDKARLLDMMASGAPLPLIGGAGEREDEFSVEAYEATLPSVGLTPLPAIPGVSAGYVGHVPVTAFIELLEREDGQGLREAIFHQNVRGYQGDGGVNERIRTTLSGPERAHFLLRNNGVTIVSDAIEPEEDGVTLTNYQVVNGLQTSTVIYRLRDALWGADDVHVPVKLVAADDWTLRRAIIEATNRQTPITGAALYAACEKAVEIERFFKLRAAAGGAPLFLERRPGQFPPDFSHKRVSLEDMLRAFYAVFREAPQVSEKGMSAIAGELDDDLLAPSLSPEPYYVAARLLTLVRDIAAARDEPRLAQIEHHGAFALRVMAAPEAAPIGDAVAMRAMCQRIERALAGAERRPEVAAALMRVTESPRERLRSGAQGVATLKRTKDAVERRARAETLEAAPVATLSGGRPQRADVA